MMSSEAGYTTALLKASTSLGNVAEVSGNLPIVLELINNCAVYFKNPRIRSREKADVLAGLLDGKIDELTAAFVVLLTLRMKLKLLPGICKRFKQLADELAGRAYIRVILPYEPSDELLDKLKRHLIEIGLCQSENLADIVFDVIIDKSIIGGFIAESDSRIVDMSLKTRLRRVRQTSVR